jgi:cation diffusion facilitator CzcD-associated flavoprotein CzcO
LDRTSTTSADTLDVVIVGAGFAGLYAIHKFRGLGFSLRCFEAAPEPGGTWWWNGYPGARCDVESLDYCYGFDLDLMNEWKWTERFATQPEILSYVNHVVERYDLARDITFNARVTSAVWDEASRTWLVGTSAGEQVRARFVITAAGCLSLPNKPDFPGLDEFKGQWAQTSAWPKDGLSLEGKRVAVIGTGSSGIQAIPEIAKQAAHLTVFQRTPQYTIPAVNRPMDPAYEAKVRSDYMAHRNQCLQNKAGTPRLVLSDSAFDLSEEERNAAYERKWQAGGAGGVAAIFGDTLTNLEANDTAAEFVRRKIREIVKDPEVAESLTPRDYPISTKRICIDSDYYATFNRENVRLVDLRKAPIDRITPNGVKVGDEEFPVDVIVFATGFDAVTGPLLAMNIKGVGGKSLNEAWADGPHTYLGLMVSGFPNLLTVTGPGSPSVLINVIVAIEQHVNWIADLLAHMRKQGLDRVDADEAAQEAWGEEVRTIANQTLFPRANSWYMGANVPGKPRVFLAYVGGYPAYAERCNQITADGYPGFHLTGGGAKPPEAARKTEVA